MIAAGRLSRKNQIRVLEGLDVGRIAFKAMAEAPATESVFRIAWARVPFLISTS